MYAVMLVIFRQTFARIKQLVVRFSGLSYQHAMHVVIAQFISTVFDSMVWVGLQGLNVCLFVCIVTTLIA